MGLIERDKMLFRVAGLGLLLVAAGVVTIERSDGATRSDRLALEPCHVARLAEQVRCGVHEVFEDRRAAAGHRIPIHVAVLPALRRSVAPDPLFIMSGGPGQGARSFGAVAARFFKGIRRSREIVLVDLRGTGDSHPLNCRPADDGTQIGWYFDDRALSTCLATLDADPRHYTQTNALADLDEIRRALGYDRVNLWGGSWGTRAALLYALTYPDAVRTVVLDGAVPFELEFPRSASTDAQRALDLLFETCSADAACVSAFPNARAELADLLAQLRRGPIDTRMRHPRTGAVVGVTLTLEVFVEIVRVALYTPRDASLLLRVLHHAAEGDVGPLAAQFVLSASTSTDEMAWGATLSVLCSEDLPLVDSASFAADAAGSWFGTGYADAWRTRCGQWPAGPRLTVDPNVTSSAPALILSGLHDPVTPPRWGEAMGRRFPRHAHVVVAGAAHNTSFSGCVPKVIATFLDRGTAVGLDSSCAQNVAWPPFVVSDAGGIP